MKHCMKDLTKALEAFEDSKLQKNQFNRFTLTEDDVILVTTYASVSNWNSGQKVIFEFTTEKESVATQIGGEYME